LDEDRYSISDLIELIQTPCGLLRASESEVIERAKAVERRGFSRKDAIEALASSGDPRAVPVLIEALNDSDGFVYAGRALAKLRDARAVQPLIDVLRDHDKFWVRRGAAAVALGNLGDIAIPALPALREALQYECEGAGEKWDLRAKEAVADAIAHILDPSAPCSLKGKGYRFEMWGTY